MRTSKILFLTGILALAGCALPRGDVSIPTLGPRLRVTNAPAGAVLVIDARMVGEASRYQGEPDVLQVEPGTHLVEVRLGGTLLLSQKLFWGSTELRTITF